MSFVPVTWSSGDPITLSKLSQMTANDDYLKDMLPDIEYYAFGEATPKNKNIVVVAQSVDLGSPSTGMYSQIINFPDGAFAPACNPIVVASLVKGLSKDTGLVVQGLNGLDINADGFIVRVVHDNNNSGFNTAIRCNYIAIGWNVA